MRLSQIFSVSLLSVISLYTVSCQAGSVPEKPSTTSAVVSKSLCPGADRLISLIGSKVIYGQPPEIFFKSSSEFMRLQRDSINSDGLPVREIVYSAVEGSWLVDGHSAYFVNEKHTRLRDAVFKFSPVCFKSPGDFIQQSKLAIGKGYRDATFPSPDDAIKVFRWTWKDADSHYVRLLQVSVSGSDYEIEIKIDPAPEGES